MGIPLISEALNGIKTSIDWLLRTVPRPVLFFLFIFFISLIGNFVLPIIFMASGTFCVEDVKYESDGFNPLENFGLLLSWFQFEDNANNTKQVDDTVTVGPSFGCSDLFTIQNGSQMYFYEGHFCTDCKEVNTSSPEYGYVVIGSVNHTNDGYCLGDVTRKDSKDLGWFKRAMCRESGESFFGVGCNPPPNYFYNQSVDEYHCVTDDCQQAEVLNFQHDIAETHTRSPIQTDTPLVGLKCVDSTPKFAIANIDIFNYKLWILLIVILLLWWGYTKIR